MSCKGLPGEIPPAFLDEVFWCLTCSVGQLHERLVEGYTQLPWCLGKLLSSEASSKEREDLASWFVGLPECCLDQAFGVPMRERVQTPADILPDGKCIPILECVSHTKIFNIEIENNFARMQSMKRVGRGRSDITSNLAAKHFMAEAKLTHIKHIKLLLSHHESRIGELLTSNPSTMSSFFFVFFPDFQGRFCLLSGLICKVLARCRLHFSWGCPLFSIFHCFPPEGLIAQVKKKSGHA